MVELLIHNAEEKLKSECKSENTNNLATLIQKSVIATLVDFCKQEKRIADTIIKSERKFYECCDEICKDIRTKRCVSDFEVYRKAIKFYIPKAEIECNMVVKLNGGADDSMKLSLLDLLE